MDYQYVENFQTLPYLIGVNDSDMHYVFDAGAMNVIVKDELISQYHDSINVANNQNGAQNYEHQNTSFSNQNLNPNSNIPIDGIILQLNDDNTFQIINPNLVNSLEDYSVVNEIVDNVNHDEVAVKDIAQFDVLSEGHSFQIVNPNQVDSLSDYRVVNEIVDNVKNNEFTAKDTSQLHTVNDDNSYVEFCY